VDYTVAAQLGEVLGLGQPAVSATADPDPEGPGPSSAPLEMAINAPTSKSLRTRLRRLARASRVHVRPHARLQLMPPPAVPTQTPRHLAFRVH